MERFFMFLRDLGLLGRRRGGVDGESEAEEEGADGEERLLNGRTIRGLCAGVLMRRAVGGDFLRAMDEGWSNFGEDGRFLGDWMIGAEDMNYTTSASPCLQAIRWIK